MRCYYPRGGYPCGKCPACLLNKQRQFAFRLEAEQKYSSYTIWITLTYSDEHLPYSPRGNPVVSKKDCRQWFDRIRKSFPIVRVKHFLTSEYGPKTFRPHYHCLLFIKDPSPIGNHWMHYRDMVSYIQDKSWQKGFVCIKPLNMSVYQYIAKYCCKPELVGFVPDEKPFQLISKGIGVDLLQYLPADSMIHNMDFSVYSRGKKIELPRYYKQKILPVKKPCVGFGDVDPVEMDEYVKNKDYWQQYNFRYSKREFESSESERLNHSERHPGELPYYEYKASQKQESVNRMYNKIQRRNNL